MIRSASPLMLGKRQPSPSSQSAWSAVSFSAFCFTMIPNTSEMCSLRAPGWSMYCSGLVCSVMACVSSCPMTSMQPVKFPRTSPPSLKTICILSGCQTDQYHVSTCRRQSCPASYYSQAFWKWCPKWTELMTSAFLLSIDFHSKCFL